MRTVNYRFSYITNIIDVVYDERSRRENTHKRVFKNAI